MCRHLQCSRSLYVTDLCALHYAELTGDLHARAVALRDESLEAAAA